MELSEFEVADDMNIDGLKIVQDKRLYRFTSDSVLLSKFAVAKKKDEVAEFCAGSGIVAYHFYALNREKFPHTPFTLFELQKELHDLSVKTAAVNRFENFSFVNCPLQEIPKEYHGWCCVIHRTSVWAQGLITTNITRRFAERKSLLR